jgi:hypothetical protein
MTALNFGKKMCDMNDNRSIRRWQFVAILTDETEVELNGIPFISAVEDDIRTESVKRALKYEAETRNWVKDVVIRAV